MSAFRLAGANRDRVVVGSDSGDCISKFDKEKNGSSKCTKKRLGNRGEASSAGVLTWRSERRAGVSCGGETESGVRFE